MALLRLENVTKKFAGLTAIEECCIEVEAGSVCGLIGPNGAGKTTLFNIISGLEQPTGGRIFFKDRNITGLRPHERVRFGIARTFQLISLFSGMSVLDNVMMGLHAHTRSDWIRSLLRLPRAIAVEREAKARSEELLRFVGLEGPGRSAGDLARNLPYGDQRLLEIARALATKPDLLLLDEPGAGMNDVEMQRLMQIITGIRDMGIAILFVEHDMKFTAAIAETIAVLDHGVTIAEGTPDEIQSNALVREAYLGRPQ